MRCTSGFVTTLLVCTPPWSTAPWPAVVSRLLETRGQGYNSIRPCGASMQWDLVLAAPGFFAILGVTTRKSLPPVYDRKEDWQVPIKAAMRQLSQFENLFKNMGDVENGFPKAIEFSQLENRDEYNPRMLQEHMMFGTPEELIAKRWTVRRARCRSLHQLREHGSGFHRTEAFSRFVHR